MGSSGALACESTNFLENGRRNNGEGEGEKLSSLQRDRLGHGSRRRFTERCAFQYLVSVQNQESEQWTDLGADLRTLGCFKRVFRAIMIMHVTGLASSLFVKPRSKVQYRKFLLLLPHIFSIGVLPHLATAKALHRTWLKTAVSA